MSSRWEHPALTSPTHFCCRPCWRYISMSTLILHSFLNIFLFSDFKWTTTYGCVCRHILECRFTRFAPYVGTCRNLYKDLYLGTEEVLYLLRRTKEKHDNKEQADFSTFSLLLYSYLYSYKKQSWWWWCACHPAI